MNGAADFHRCRRCAAPQTDQKALGNQLVENIKISSRISAVDSLVTLAVVGIFPFSKSSNLHHCPGGGLITRLSLLRRYQKVFRSPGMQCIKLWYYYAFIINPKATGNQDFC